MKPPTLFTKRLLLRRWADDDREVFAQINADPEVMRYRFKPLARQESYDLIENIETCFDQHGFGQWAVERIEDRRVIGFIGLEVADDSAPFSPRVHIGWHLAMHGAAATPQRALPLVWTTSSRWLDSLRWRRTRRAPTSGPAQSCAD